MGKKGKGKQQQNPESEPVEEDGDEDMGIGDLLSEPPALVSANNWAAPQAGDVDPWGPSSNPARGHNRAGGKQQHQNKGARNGKGKNQQQSNDWTAGSTWGTGSVADNAGWGTWANDNDKTRDSANIGWGGAAWNNDEDEDEEGEDDPWGAPGEHTWSEPVHQSGWRGWSDEAKRNSKSFGGANNAGNKNPLSQQQQSQILQSLLSQPTQNPYLAHLQSAQGNQYPHTSGNQKQGKQHGQQQEQKLSKKQKKQLKKEQEAQGNHDRHHSESNPWTAAAMDYGWGPIAEEDEEEYDDGRRVHFTPSRDATNLWADPGRPATSYTIPPPAPSSSYSMPSRTLAHAYKGTTTSLELGPPYNALNEYTSVKFEESHGEALKPAHQALFGKARFAKDRIHWMFRPDHDPRVVSVLNWIQAMSYNLGTYGLHKFLQSRERGALLTNVDYRSPKNPKQPCFDWLTFDDLQPSMDKILQESVAFYDPAVQVIVFVFLPSKSGNSVAMWRRKINVPNNTRLMLQGEIRLCMSGLRREKDYLVHVDELPGTQRTTLPSPAPPAPRLRRSSLPARTKTKTKTISTVDDLWAKPKKRKWWQTLFRVDW